MTAAFVLIALTSSLILSLSTSDEGLTATRRNTIYDIL
jgi:hypothetical protein